MTSEPYSGSVPGVPCPRCGSRIVISFESLLASRGIQCASCGLELTIDSEQSGKALEALRQYNAQLEAIRREQGS